MKTFNCLCEHCGAPVITGRVYRKFHPKCYKVHSKLREKAWYQDNLERERAKRKSYSKGYRRSNPKNRMLAAAKDRAKLQKLPFEITLEDIPDWGTCPVLGVTMEVGSRYSPSLDKIIPEKGYVRDNIQVISWKANMMKQDATQEELERFAKWVLKL